jgi:hypothetical protein
MLRRSYALSTIVALTFGLYTSALGGVIYNEAVSGDLSNSGLSPTNLGSLTVGSNEVLGTTGSSGGVVDRDYFTVTVPTGFAMSSIIVLPGTESGGGGISFIGIETGDQVTVSTNSFSAAGLLGWWHYSPADINNDILPFMATPSDGSSGFSPPLGAGDYSFWVQELSPGAFPYGFNLELSSVPEPTSFVTMLCGLVIAVPVILRRSRGLARQNGD